MSNVLTSGQLALSATGSSLLTADTSRTALYVSNHDTTAAVIIGFGATVTGTGGFRLPPNTTLDLRGYKGSLGAIATGTQTPTISYLAY